MEIAVIDDEQGSAEILSDHIARYFKENATETVSVTIFKNAVSFLKDYKMQYALIFMDIDMPYMNGMTAAHKLRELDEQVPLVFVTNLARMAVQGYSVSALDFMVKPVSYVDFSMKMKRILKFCNNSETVYKVIRTDNTLVKLSIDEIKYIEVLDHRLVYHTADREYVAYGTMKKLEEDAEYVNFARCNNCYFVNLRYVEKVKGFTVTLVGGVELAISHPKKPEFVRALNKFLGGA